MYEKFKKTAYYILTVWFIFVFCYFSVIFFNFNTLFFLIPGAFVVTPIVYKGIKVLHDNKRINKNKKHISHNDIFDHTNSEYKTDKEIRELSIEEILSKTRFQILIEKDPTNEERFAREKEINRNIPSKAKIKQLIKRK